MKAFLVAMLLLLPGPAFAQYAPDAVNVQSARVFASPGDMMRWPITCSITSVTFTDVGFPTIGTCMDGPGRWPDVVPDGWEGPIQHTLGMCLLAPDGETWECSAVVQVWYPRWLQDPNYTTAPYAVGSNWFYASHMMGGGGSLTDRNPRPGERVLIFVVRGNGRVGTEYTKVHERSNVAMVTWGQNYEAGQPQQPTDPGQPQQPQQPQQPGQSDPPVDMSDIRTLIRLTMRSDQAEGMFADIIARDEERKAQIAEMRTALEARIDKNGLETFLKDKRVQAIGSAVMGFFAARSQTLGNGQPAGMSSAVAAVSGLAILAAR